MLWAVGEEGGLYFLQSPAPQSAEEEQILDILPYVQIKY